MQNHFKNCRGENVKQALKCFKNAQTGKERKQGNKSIEPRVKKCEKTSTRAKKTRY